jgi:hypothetical protein
MKVNLLREICHGATLVAEFWIYGAAYALAQLLTWDDDDFRRPFENQLVPAPEVAIV